MLENVFRAVPSVRLLVCNKPFLGEVELAFFGAFEEVSYPRMERSEDNCCSLQFGVLNSGDRLFSVDVTAMKAASLSGELEHAINTSKLQQCRGTLFAR